MNFQGESMLSCCLERKGVLGALLVCCVNASDERVDTVFRRSRTISCRLKPNQGRQATGGFTSGYNRVRMDDESICM